MYEYEIIEWRMHEGRGILKDLDELGRAGYRVVQAWQTDRHYAVTFLLEREKVPVLGEWK